MATFVTALGPVSKQVWYRLVVAGAASLLLHLALLLGVSIQPAGSGRDDVSMLFARLEPAPESTPARDIAEPKAEENTLPAREDSPAQPVASRAEARAKPQPAVAPQSAAGGGIELPFVRDPTYYPVRQLDVYPQPLTPLKLDYPATARADGRLLVLLLIDEFGIVNEASIVEAEPPGYFEEAALAVFRAARFSPAQKQGKAVKSRALLQVNYIYGDNQAAVR